MSAVQGAICSIDGDIDARHTADAEHRLLASGLMHRPVADDERIGFQKICLVDEDRTKGRRARFFLGLKKESEVDCGFYFLCGPRVERSDNSEHAGLVAARRA